VGLDSQKRWKLKAMNIYLHSLQQPEGCPPPPGPSNGDRKGEVIQGETVSKPQQKTARLNRE